MLRRLAMSLALALPVVTASAVPAAAQSAAPIGVWRTADGSEGLVVQANRSCGFLFRGRPRYSGTCTWQSSYRGGILTLTYPMPLAPGHIRWSIVWINATTITVTGDVFHKIGN